MIAKEYSTLYYYDLKGELVKLDDCLIHNQFIFDKQNFVLLSKRKRYYVCMEHSIPEKKKKDILLSFWGYPLSEGLTSGEIVSIFRKEYKKNEINCELIQKFFDKPLKHSLLKIKKKRTKKNGEKKVS